MWSTVSNTARNSEWRWISPSVNFTASKAIGGLRFVMFENHEFCTSIFQPKSQSAELENSA